MNTSMNSSYLNKTHATDDTLNQSFGPVADYSVFYPSPEADKDGKFRPLSERGMDPDATFTFSHPVDVLTLAKSSPKANPEDIVDKDLKDLMKDTCALLTFGLGQSKHQKEIHNELRALLDHEKKILVQLMDRSTKFTNMKEDNKKNTESWETEHKERMTFYRQYLKELIDIPENQSLTQEGVPGEVQQRILYRIVESTSGVADDAIVQLSIQNSLVNDVDLSLTKLSQFCVFMTRQIDNWMRMLNTQEPHQLRVLDQWVSLKSAIKKIKENKEDTGAVLAGISKADLQNMMQAVDTRLSKLENTVKDIKSQSIVVGSPGKTPYPIQEQYQPPQHTPQQQPQPRQLQFTPSPSPAAGQPSSPSPPSQRFPTGEDYFGFPASPPSPNSPRPGPLYMATPPPEASQTEGRLQRSRATPGQFPVDVLEIPGMGFPIPRAALERGGRPMGQYVPKTPPSPVPPQYGRFMPMAASSPRGSIRRSLEFVEPSHPQMGQPMDPALLPKIQENLQKLSKRNKNLEELVANFQKMRRLLTEEMDKAVRLNQKLQRDLYYVAQEAGKNN